MAAKFVLIGSGLAGGLLAAYLVRRGYDVDLYSVTANLVPSCVDAAVSAANSDHQIIKARGDAIIGVDGAFSAVRQSMQKKIAGFEYDESYLAHGYKELTIPPAPDGSWRMEKEALHIWPRKSFMMIALPNPDGSITCTLFWEFAGPRRFATTKTDNDGRQSVDEAVHHAVPL